MISHVEFRALRLARFVDAPPTPLEDWEFLGRTWIGEAMGFSEWLRPTDDPENLGALSLDFASFPADRWGPVLHRLGLPLRPSMIFEEVSGHLGAPSKVESFVRDRRTYSFEVGVADRFEDSCTILANGGLSYLTVVARFREG